MPQPPEISGASSFGSLLQWALTNSLRAFFHLATHTQHLSKQMFPLQTTVKVSSNSNNASVVGETLACLAWGTDANVTFCPLFWGAQGAAFASECSPSSNKRPQRPKANTWVFSRRKKKIARTRLFLRRFALTPFLIESPLETRCVSTKSWNGSAWHSAPAQFISRVAWRKDLPAFAPPHPRSKTSQCHFSAYSAPCVRCRAG